MSTKEKAKAPRKPRLRKAAEAQLARVAKSEGPLPPAEELLHELQVHQIELEMQNDQLRRTQVALEESRDRYVDLYEFAPVGYLVVTAEGLISDVNLTGAALLHVERKSLKQRRFARFIAAGDRDRWHRLFIDVLQHDERRDAEFALAGGDGFAFHARLDCVRVAAGDTPPVLRIALSDITQRKAAETEIEGLAFYDLLTQLPNRRLLLDRLGHALATRTRTRAQGAFLFIDLDNFKTLNDTRGHHIGDLLLRRVADRLAKCVRQSDTVARFGGDEFVVVLEQLNANPEEAAAEAETIGKKILATLAEPSLIAGQEYESSASIGVAMFRDDRETAEDLLQRADLAMYDAKAAGRNSLRFFDSAMQIAVTARASFEVDLRRAVRDGPFILLYQPQVDREGRLMGAEALVRWQHPRRGLVDPIEFIPVAEKFGLIVPLGRWVLRAACAEVAAWGGNPNAGGIKLAMNVSAPEFHEPDFVEQLLAVVDCTGADPRQLMLELTESVLLDHSDDTVAKMTKLKARGVSFSLDDFGIGYSSLSCLKHLPLDQVKIDQSFVRDVLTDPNDATIARAIVALGHSLGLLVIAEGVETAEQWSFLSSMGCDGFQGYLFGRPGPAEALWNMTGARNSLEATV